MLPRVHGVYEGGGDCLVTEQEVEDAAAAGEGEQALGATGVASNPGETSFSPEYATSGRLPGYRPLR